MQCEVLPPAQALQRSAQRLSHCPDGSVRSWLNNRVVATDQSLVAWSATLVALSHAQGVELGRRTGARKGNRRGPPPL